MVVGRTLRASGCAACRLAIIRTFASAPIIPIRAKKACQSARAGALNSLQQVRYSSFQSNSPLEHTLKDRGVNTDNAQETQSITLEEENIAAEAPLEAVPWYLQVDAPKTEARPLSERQRIPDLPEDPPPLLQPLLQQISVDLGLDDLTLLDLRNLDPPPALGANLLMVIGTTRSEKHLHVSADRLCRWLRTNYQLRPDADGLLGRNELKLKLKRKAKRAKLMGSANDESYDDGVRTGWVCVDVGVVEGAESYTTQVRKDFVGFGRQTDGVRIVVQMMTEEKRAEVNLEKLWSGILKRGGVQETDEETGVEAHAPETPALHQDSPAPNYKPLGIDQKNNSYMRNHTRKYHTSSRRLDNLAESSWSNAQGFDTSLKVSNDRLQGIQLSMQESFSTGNFEAARDIIIKHAKQHDVQIDEKVFFLEALKDYLLALPEDQALQTLGTGASDQESTPFLRAFYETFDIYPDQAQAELKIWLHCWAHSHQHPGHDSQTLIQLITQLQEAGARVGVGAYLDLIERILQPEPGAPKDSFGANQKNVRAVAEILRTMNNQGLEILTEDVLVRLLQATATGLRGNLPGNLIYTDDVDTYNLPAHPLDPTQKRLHLLVKHLDLSLFNENSRLSLMEMYAHQRNWVEFWDIWRLAPRQGKPRSSEFYASMFVLVAATQHIKGVQTVLRHWLPELAREDPPVMLQGNVALAVKYCLQVADPQVEQEYQEDPNSTAEWVRMWRKCEMESQATIGEEV